MLELIAWLVRAEGLAHAVYQEAMRSGGYDERLTALLERLVDDEAVHGRALAGAAEGRGDISKLVPAISLDAATSERLLGSLEAGRHALEQGGLSRMQLIETLVEAEYSEWNDIFVYVIGALAAHDTRFQYTAAEMEAHRDLLQRFLEQERGCAALRDRLRTRKSVWSRRLLVVDDVEGIRDLLQAILEEYGTVETARDGVEALERIRLSYYDVIVSDLQMPRMDGLALYEGASALRPEAAASFVFLTAAGAPEVQAVLESKGAPVLLKPVSIERLRAAVGERLTRRRSPIRVE